MFDPPPMPGTTSVDTNHETLTFESTLKPGSYVGPAFKLGLLNLITLTLYRFWARTQVRKWMWPSLKMNGESFEYTGRGIELFKGFLLALVVFTIPYLLVVFGSQLLPPLIGGPLLFAFVLFAYWAIGAAIWLSFRYLASRTVWRGIRFQLRGSAADYGWLVFGQTILTSLTLGWYGPRAFIKQAEGLWGNLSFGDLPFSFYEDEARKENLYGRFAIGWFGIALVYVALIVRFMGMSQVGDVTDVEGLDQQMSDYVMWTVIYLYAGLAFALLLFIPYHVACLRAVARGLKLDDATFRLAIRSTGYLKLLLTNILILIFSLGLLAPIATMRSFRWLTSHLDSEGTVDFSQAEQAERGPDQAEGLADSLDIGLI